MSEAITTIEGAPAAAILMMLLEESEAAAVLKHLEAEEVKALGLAMYDAAQASEDSVEQALDRFVLSSRAVSALSIDADARIRTMMSEALGNVRADNLLSAIAPAKSAATLDLLRWMDVTSIAAIIAAEHPQVGAIIISVLNPEVAAAAISGLEEAVQADLVFRAARLQSVSQEAIEDLEAIIASADRAAQNASHALGGKSDAAKIVNQLPKPIGERLLRSVRKRDRQLADAIEEEMFVFADLNALDAKSLGAVLRGVEAATLSLALKGAEAATMDRFLATMSARAAETIRDEMTDSGPVKRADVEEAQKAIIAVARAMAADGSIMLGGKNDDYV
jgi:flagellar motor switch protein FliG